MVDKNFQGYFLKSARYRISQLNKCKMKKLRKMIWWDTIPAGEWNRAVQETVSISVSNCLRSIQMISSFFSLSLTFTLRLMMPMMDESSLLTDAEV